MEGLLQFLDGQVELGGQGADHLIVNPLVSIVRGNSKTGQPGVEPSPGQWNGPANPTLWQAAF